MKIKVLILLLFTSLLTSCSINDDANNSNNEIIITQWNLINVTGGIAGVDHDFEIGDIVWRFNDPDGILLVTNENTDDTLEDALSTGSYNHLYVSQGDDTFLTVDDVEFGLITVSENDEEFTLNQNKLISGDAADGFIYTFKRTTVVVGQ